MIDQIKEMLKDKNPSVSILIPSLEEEYIKLSWSNTNSGENSDFLNDLIKRMWVFQLLLRLLCSFGVFYVQ